MSFPSSTRDEIALYLYEALIENKICTKPDKVSFDAKLYLQLSQRKKTFPPKLEDASAHELLTLVTDILDIPEIVDTSLLEQLYVLLSNALQKEAKAFGQFLDLLIDAKLFTDPDPPKPGQKTPMTIEDSQRAWDGEYQGKAHKILLDNIQKSYTALKPYANSGSIIQSSGYGKSRTVDQMSILIPTIPMNVRAKRDALEGAFPPRDAALAEMFQAVSRFSEDFRLQGVLFFFKHLFDHVCNLVEGFEGGDLTTSLNHYFKDQATRVKFYTNLRDVVASKSELDIPAGVEADAQTSYKRLFALLPEPSQLAKLVVYIDEAQTLLSLPGIKNAPTMYDVVLKAVSAFDGFFFLFLSTASRIEGLARKAGLASSSRLKEASKYLVAPLTEMPFDCHPSLPIRSGLKLEEVQKFAFAVRFGRPLFWAYHETMAADKRDNATLTMAKTKLVNADPPLPEGDTSKFAVLDTLLNLDYDPRVIHTADYNLASEMVASHMRTVYSVPASREHMHTGYSSEPVLAEAALTILEDCATKKAMTDPDPIVSFYKAVDQTRPGAIDKGQRGENVGKMILLSAYTAAVKQSRKDGTQFWGQGCNLVDFVTELTGTGHIELVLNSKPENTTSGLPLRERFKKSVVRFTHFARAADDSAMTSSMAWVAFVRGMAMIGWHSQKVVDVNIPILLDRDQGITEANMSSILVQFKVRSTRAARSKVVIRDEDITYFPPPGSSRDAVANLPDSDSVKMNYHARPYISLVMELGLVPTSKQGGVRPMVVNFLDGLPMPKATEKSKTETNTNLTKTAPAHKSSLSVSNVEASMLAARETRRRSSHPRYSLIYCGCSNRVYKCVSKEDEPIYKALLELPSVFSDPPRSIDHVLSMKPFWSAGENCYSWIDEPYFKPKKQDEEEEETVQVGRAVGAPMVVDSDPDDAMDTT